MARDLRVRRLVLFTASTADFQGVRLEGKAFYRYDTHHLMFSCDVLPCYLTSSLQISRNRHHIIGHLISSGH